MNIVVVFFSSLLSGLRDVNALTAIALNGYGHVSIAEVTAVEGDHVIISLGSRDGLEPGDRFEVVSIYTLQRGTVIEELRGVIEVYEVDRPDRAICVIVSEEFPIEVHDRIRPIP